MINKGLKKYFANPSLGLLTSILYLLLYIVTMSIDVALMISILFAIIADVSLRFYTKTKICGLMFLLSICALILTFVVRFFLKYTFVPDVFYIVVFEILMVVFLVAARLLKNTIGMFFSNSKSTVEKTFLVEFFNIARTSQYIFIFHLFIVLIYRLIRTNYPSNEILSLSIYFLIPIVFLFLFVIYQVLQTRRTVKLLRKEEWLPIVTESGEVSGRIAKSVSLTMKNKFLHPVVRIALIHNSEIYLQKRAVDDSLDPSTFDHPFEKYMLFDHQINISVRNTISRALGMQELPFKFLLKYAFENPETKRLVFLFVARVQNDQQLESIGKLHGKFWTTKQIEESFVDENLFSECFQLEYEYIKNTVILSDSLMNKDKNN